MNRIIGAWFIRVLIIIVNKNKRVLLIFLFDASLKYWTGAVDLLLYTISVYRTELEPHQRTRLVLDFGITLISIETVHFESSYCRMAHFVKSSWWLHRQVGSWKITSNSAQNAIQRTRVLKASKATLIRTGINLNTCKSERKGARKVKKCRQSSPWRIKYYKKTIESELESITEVPESMILVACWKTTVKKYTLI